MHESGKKEWFKTKKKGIKIDKEEINYLFFRQCNYICRKSKGINKLLELLSEFARP